MATPTPAPPPRSSSSASTSSSPRSRETRTARRRSCRPGWHQRHPPTCRHRGTPTCPPGTPRWTNGSAPSSPKPTATGPAGGPGSVIIRRHRCGGRRPGRSSPTAPSTTSSATTRSDPDPTRTSRASSCRPGTPPTTPSPPAHHHRLMPSPTAAERLLAHLTDHERDTRYDDDRRTDGPSGPSRHL